MNILEFIQKFPDEGACRLKFKEQRDQIGIICGKCNCKEHYWLQNKLCYEYLQYYLNEDCYKFNRRYFGDQIFDRLLITAVSYSPYFKSKIYNRTLCR